MYKSPIEVITKTMVERVDADIVRAVQSHDIKVDKAELLKALQYDRGQYEKGYADGKREAEVRAYWIGRPLDNFRKYEVKCSECGWTGIENYDSYNDPSSFYYCPNCGARMDKEVDDE